MGLFNAAAAAASALGAITGGAVADRFGYESVNVFAAAGALLSLLCVLPLRNARRHSEFEESSSCSSSSSSSRIPIVSQSD